MLLSIIIYVNFITREKDFERRIIMIDKSRVEMLYITSYNYITVKTGINTHLYPMYVSYNIRLITADKIVDIPMLSAPQVYELCSEIKKSISYIPEECKVKLNLLYQDLKLVLFDFSDIVDTSPVISKVSKLQQVMFDMDSEEVLIPTLSINGCDLISLEDIPSNEGEFGSTSVLSEIQEIYAFLSRSNFAYDSQFRIPVDTPVVDYKLQCRIDSV